MSERGKKHFSGPAPSEVHTELIDNFKLLLKGIDPETGENYFGTARVCKP